jgi:hypothetical protein
MIYDQKAALPERPAISNYTAINKNEVKPFDNGTILGPVTQQYANHPISRYFNLWRPC